MTKIISIIALRRAILMKADPVVSFHANRMFMQKQTPVNVYMRSSSICVFEDRGKPEYPKKKKKKKKQKKPLGAKERINNTQPTYGVHAGI